jgi:hypothetical protein
LIVIAVLTALYKKDRELSLQAWTLSVLSVLPLVGVITVSLLRPEVTVLIPRVILVFAPAVVALAAVGLTPRQSGTLTFATLLLLSAASLWWLYSSSYYTIPTKSDFRGVAQEIARLEENHDSILVLSPEPDFITRKGDQRGYYWEMFGIQSDVFQLPESASAHELLRHIEAKRKEGKYDKVILVSHHIRRKSIIDLVDLCEKSFHKEDEKQFTGFGPRATFLVSYSLQPLRGPKSQVTGFSPDRSTLQHP